LTSQGNNGVETSLKDCTYALQFIKYYAESFNINTDKIFLQGTSAGAGTSLWIGLSDDLSEVNSSDPIKRMSTSVVGILASETQATYDLVQWETIFSSYSFNLSLIQSTVVSFYSLASYSELNNQSTIDYRERVDILSLIDANAPEIWVNNSNIPNVDPTTSTSILYHHPLHALALKTKADSVGLTSQFYISGLSINDTANESDIDFILRMNTK
jgi:hypothetical protein